MKRTAAIIATAMLTTPALASNASTCKDPAIAQKGRVSAAQCTCMLKGADKYLDREDKAFLIAYWTGKRNDNPNIYFANAYPSGKNKPLIKYSAYTAGLCN
ncbi:hypothetical protein Q4544_12965 [Cognatishimia sp. 1_MG-2023]|uniref:hypothetical protein n=1 Tax=Cognatishimia sp. 1_MG-2023 TaxID=3062642 RepID=UPI0026E18F1F|nr:hypothetical protein [Cognatishimia sp. 1_MG-2023]MDO6727845.1 hypothetical protein [Cognatishimia sp. 1_MG-2023]